jgi:putative acetyltransferase
VDTRIRTETAADASVIETVTRQAFRTAAHASFTEHLIPGALRAAGALSVSVVAEVRGVVIGHAAASPVAISDGTPGWFGLGPVAVLPQHQRRGAGSMLVHAVLRRLRERCAAGCVVLGDPAYYSRFGFRAIPELVLTAVPPAYFQALSFDARAPRGTVSYHAAFGTSASA